MRIGIDTRYLAYPYTGIPIFVHDMLYYFNTYDRKNEYFLYTDNDYKLDFDLKENFHLIKGGIFHGTIWVKCDLNRLIKRDDIDLFWEPMHFLPSGIQSIKSILTVHDCALFAHPEWGAWSNSINHKFFLKDSCRKANCIMAISESTKTDIIKYTGVKAEKIQVIYNGDSMYTFEASDNIIASSDEILNKYGVIKEEYIIFISTIEPRKNIITIIKAFNEFKNKTQSKLKLVFAGKRGWRNNEFDEALHKSRYKNDVIITGYISDIEKEVLLRNSCALVYPSLYEGFGFPPLEAMSVGIPVVTTKVSSLPEVCGNAALYMNDPYNHIELSELIEEVYFMPKEKRDIVVAKGIKQSSKFSRKETALEMMRLFREV